MPDRDNPIADLLTAVEALTKPVHTAFMQHEVEGTDRNARTEGIVKRTDPSLLEQLRAAITSDIGGGAGSAKAARERTSLDVAAFSLYEEIDGRVRAWLLDVGVRPSGKAELGSILVRWFILWKQKRLEDATVHAHQLVLERWASSIRDLLDPPVKQEITSPCPSCGAMWATVGRGEETESVRALWAVWREDPDESYGLCRSCDKVWRGVGMMRTLRIAIDDAELATRP